MLFCPFCGQPLKESKFDLKTGRWSINCGLHRAQLSVAGELELHAGFNWLFSETVKKELCPTCFYFGRTRVGPVCNYYGDYDPRKIDCSAFKPSE